MSLKKILGNWERITTPAKLRKVILQTAESLTKRGDTVTAERFIKSAERTPESMEKESISYVLFAICVEVRIIE